MATKEMALLVSTFGGMEPIKLNGLLGAGWRIKKMDGAAISSGVPVVWWLVILEKEDG